MSIEHTDSIPTVKGCISRLLAHTSLQTLANWLVGAAFFCLFVTLSITLAAHTRHTAEQIETQYRSNAIDSLASQLSAALQSGDVEAVDLLLRQGAALDWYDYARVTDLSGNVLYSSASTAKKSLKSVSASGSNRDEPLVEQVSKPILAADDTPMANFNVARHATTDRYAWSGAGREVTLLILPIVLLFGGLMLWVVRGFAVSIKQARDYALSTVSKPGKPFDILLPVGELAGLRNALLTLSCSTARHYELLVSEGAIRASALAACKEGLLVLDDSFQIIEANNAAEAVLNAPRSDLLHSPVCDFICDRWIRASNLPQNDVPLRLCVARDSTTGSADVWVEIAIARFYAQSSKFWLLTVSDLSDEIAAEKKNRQLAKDLATINNELSVRQRALDEHAMVFTCDAQGFVMSCNQKFAEITGCSLSHLAHRPFVFTRDIDREVCLNEEIFETLFCGNTWQGDTICWNVKGKMFWVAFTIVPLPAEGGEAAGFLAVGTDISTQKSLEFDLHEARLEQARTSRDIQTTLLVSDIPKTIGFADIRSYLLAAEDVAGDFIAFSRLNETCFDIMVGDVMGSGVTAALVAAATKSSYYKALLQPAVNRNVEGDTPDLEVVVNTIHARMSQRLIELEMFVTLAIYRFDAKTSTLIYVNAGHTPGILHRSDGSGIEELTSNNVPIGFLDQVNYESKSTLLNQSDLVCLFSDGISEALLTQSDEQLGIERIKEQIRSSTEHNLPLNCLYQSLILDVQHSTGRDSPYDDQSLTIIEYTKDSSAADCGIRQSIQQTLELEWDYSSVRKLREFFQQIQMPLEDEVKEGLLLACVEACTNIVRHVVPYLSNPSYTFRIETTGTDLYFDFFYAGPGHDFDEQPEPDFSGETSHGFGLFIISELTDQFFTLHPSPYISQIRLVKHLDPSSSHRGVYTASMLDA